MKEKTSVTVALVNIRTETAHVDTEIKQCYCDTDYEQSKTNSEQLEQFLCSFMVIQYARY